MITRGEVGYFVRDEDGKSLMWLPNGRRAKRSRVYGEVAKIFKLGLTAAQYEKLVILSGTTGRSITGVLRDLIDGAP